MKLSEQNILIISPEPWDHISVSKHHYARTLAKMGSKVVFANPPKNTWSLKQTEFPNLKVLDYPKFISGLRKLPSFISQRIIKRKLNQIEKFCIIYFDIIWSFDNSVFFDFTLLKPKLCISHIVDINMEYKIECATRTAEIVFYVNSAIGNKVNQWNKNCHFINHGYNEKTPTVKNNPSKELRKVGYAGNLNIKYIDWNTMEKLFTTFRNIEFHLAGPIHDKSRFSKFSNVVYRGVISSESIQDFYCEMDALLICYLADEYKDQLSNPHKMMEYLGSGKPIISSYTEEYANLSGNELLMSETNEDILLCFNKLYTQYQGYSNNEVANSRKKIASNNSYQKQIDRIALLLK